MTSFHNTCDVRETEPGHGICRTHSVPVYRDGIDWCVDLCQDRELQQGRAIPS